MLDIKKEKSDFMQLSFERKLEKVEAWIGELAYHYDYFRDLEVYIKIHKSDINEDFLNASFQIINLAKEIGKA